MADQVYGRPDPTADGPSFSFLVDPNIISRTEAVLNIESAGTARSFRVEML